ncbi:hypothetical protein CTEN210_00435 [Chaetoceros tenuissimus]|uniref:Uncharacterized protein n=1 Tax=Chaetoceros tenuissimus TaxID=426638 RepID=A0AAD3CDU5_9STRA|nr:hypothetical protein CTEN210_00435 [Chaetoceros tenuissimus]
MDISKFQSNLDFIKSLYFHEEWKDENCRDTILEVLEEANKKIENAFGKSMHRLGKYKPSEEAVEKLVKKFPSTISYEVRCGRLPIQTAADYDDNAVYDCAGSAPKYVPLLAKEGLKYQVGGEEARGGLLLFDPVYEESTLQVLCYNESDETEASRLATLKELRKLGLFVKKDIVEHTLLYNSLCNEKHVIFDYLVEWDSNSLLTSRDEDKPLIFTVCRHTITHLLKAGFKYHPDTGGLLFVEHDNGIRALDFVLKAMGREDFVGTLQNILSPTKDYAILHHVLPKASKHREIFTNKFPWAGSLKDHNGRSLHQVLLAAGPKVMNEYGLLFATLTDEQIQEKDPISTLFPFAAMAVGEHADLEKCFYLLRRHPSVLDKRSRANASVSRRRKKQKVSK